jgi:NAD(P)-dependent dehydrogenase (short-subunit alcohol dehydrogenase family)
MTFDLELANRCALVTGGTRGVGNTAIAALLGHAEHSMLGHCARLLGS